MIVVCHSKNQVKSLEKEGHRLPVSSKTIAVQLFEAAARFPDALIVWCESPYREQLNPAGFADVFHHKRVMASYGSKRVLPKAIGYVEDSPFIKINPDVNYPTWQMHTEAGGIHASVLLAVKGNLKPDTDFGYFINSLAKLTMPQGVFCYHAPSLLSIEIPADPEVSGDNFNLLRFVKQHYKTRWVFLLFLNLVWHEKSFPLVSLIRSLFFRRRRLGEKAIDDITFQSNRKTTADNTLDVVIPTMGRKAYLYDVLKDLGKQHPLPRKVIVVEQNPDPESNSALDYLKREPWPFPTKHIFTHKTGACHARNLGLKEVTSEWVFLADDDIRLDAGFIAQAFEQIRQTGTQAVTFSCLQQHERKQVNRVVQWNTFGSGCSFVNAGVLKSMAFDTAFEHGYGEDADYGMQLRNKGVDVIYVPEPEILHLKAPVGGFREPPVFAWNDDPIPPKPSPTIMLFHLKHHTREQLLGYKTVLFFKYYRKQAVKNPFQYYRRFKNQWQKSVFWAKQLMNTNTHH